ncbi:helix-turn-helix domain-containing protein [Hyalangium versicolor]|uniref:helix-turn-helix domain-containing protein n=1 Tax=Hyalangium versicolor TaxID=2861190 RepID=UPI001CCCD545|nr:helix-turn-helix domain-containing protein [Hyalangium versicolor]
MARLLGCSPKGVYARVSRGQSPGAFRVGRPLRFRGSELLPFIAPQCLHPRARGFHARTIELFRSA